MKFKQFSCGLAAAAWLGTGAAAQGAQWAYIGPAELFEGLSAEDFSYAQVCVSTAWTPANSGMPGLAAQWTPLVFQTARDLQLAVAQQQCDVAAVARDALATQPDLLRTAQSLDLSDMTQVLIAADGGPAGLVDAAPAQALNDTVIADAVANTVVTNCGRYPNYSLVMDCSCLGTLASEGLANGTFTVPEDDVNRAGLTITNALTQEGAPAACINEQGVAAYLGDQADSFSARMPPELARAQITPAAYRACVVSEGLIWFQADRGMSLMSGSNDMLTASMVACMTR